MSNTSNEYITLKLRTSGSTVHDPQRCCFFISLLLLWKWSMASPLSLVQFSSKKFNSLIICDPWDIVESVVLSKLVQSHMCFYGWIRNNSALSDHYHLFISHEDTWLCGHYFWEIIAYLLFACKVTYFLYLKSPYKDYDYLQESNVV